MRLSGFPFGRQPFGFLDAQHPLCACVDRWSAVCDHITFSVFRFGGFSFQARASAADLFRKGFLAGFCFHWNHPGFWICRLAASVAAPIQRLRFGTGAILVLDALYFRKPPAMRLGSGFGAFSGIADRQRELQRHLTVSGAFDRNIERVIG